MISTLSKNEESIDALSLYEDNYIFSSAVEDCAEYHNAKRRFNSQYYSNDTSMNEEEDDYLDNLIFKLCNENEIQLENNASLFFRLLFRADFLQLSQNAKRKFYHRMCSHFVFMNDMEDITYTVDDLDLIPHVKMEMFLNIINILNLKMKFENKCLILSYISRVSWYERKKLEGIDHIILEPSAYKVMLEKFGLSLSHLNFILRLLKIKNLTLNGCNLNWRDENILNGLILTKLHMSHCGSSINQLISGNFENLRDNLRELDISNCPVLNKTLELISQFDLKKLNIENCAKKNGYFIGNIWTECEFGTSEICYVDTNILWAEENLRNSLKHLEIGCTELDYTNLEEILQLDLLELNVSRSCEIWGEDFRSLWRNSMQNLKVLRIRDIEIDFSLLATLFELKIGIFEFSYDAVKNFNDFAVLLKTPMAESLQELTIDLKNHCQTFIHFLSKLKLKYFECKLGTWYFYNFDIFWTSRNRKYLKTLILEDGKLSETDAKGISSLKLETLSLHPFLFDSKQQILLVLASRILQRSVVDLRMGGAYEVDSDHLDLLENFECLRRLSLKISGTNLTHVFSKKLEYFKTLKELRLQVYIGLNVDEQAANALCTLPNGTHLTIVLVGLGKKWPLTFSEKATQVFILKNCMKNSDISVHLELTDCSLDYRCGKIFNKFNVESLILNSCVLDNFWVSFLEEKIIFTLQILIMKRVDIDLGQLMMLKKICVNELSILTSMDDFGYNKLPIILSDGAISKSLNIFRFGPYSCIPYIEYILRTKISVYQSYPQYLL